MGQSWLFAVDGLRVNGSACADMLSIGFMGAENGNIPIGGAVAVLAQGPVGLMAIAGATS